MNKKHRIILFGGVSVDSDAQAYFTAAGITTAGEKTAWNNTVVALKAAGLYTGNIFWPFLGTISSQQKYNAVNPANTDGANRLAFAGTATYTTSGYLPDGLDGYADTFFDPTTFSGSAGSLGFMSLTSAQGSYDMSSSSGGSSQLTGVIARYSNDTQYAGMGTGTFATSIASLDGKGFFAASRLNGTTTEAYKNGLKVKSAVDGATPIANTIFIGADNQGLAAHFSSRQFAFSFIIPLGLTEAQHLTFYNIIYNNFLTPLGRI